MNGEYSGFFYLVCNNGIVIMCYVLEDGIDECGFLIFRVFDFFGNYF